MLGELCPVSWDLFVALPQVNSRLNPIAAPYRPPIHAPTGDRTQNLGTCPDLELNLQDGVQEDTQPAEPPSWTLCPFFNWVVYFVFIGIHYIF